MKSSEIDNPRVSTWQKKLLPLMIAMLGGLTIFFFIASFIQIYYLHEQINQGPQLNLAPALSIIDVKDSISVGKDKLNLARWATLATLDGQALQSRYHQAKVLLMSRIWTRYLGFVTGMILSLIGAAFILGKLREPETQLDTEGLWKFSITTSSPGLILAILGTILMITTIVTHHTIEVKDVPSYTLAWFQPAASEKSAIESGKPPDLDKITESARAKSDSILK